MDVIMSNLHANTVFVNMIKSSNFLSHSSDTIAYFPHSERRQRIRGDQSVKDTLYSQENLMSISKLASDTPCVDTRAILYQNVSFKINAKRQELHQDSKERTKLWSNTVYGERLKRLHAAGVKARAQEV